MLQTNIYGSLKDQSVFVTGGASGIGAAIVAAFWAQGANVAFCDCDGDAGVELVGSLPVRSDGKEALFLKANVTDTVELCAAIDEASEENGAVTILVNNVGSDARHPTLEVDDASWRKTMSVNLNPAFFASQHVLKSMVEMGRGSIVFLSSMNALNGMTPSMAGYIAAKGGVISLAKAIAMEFGPSGVRANSLVPAWVATQRQLDNYLTPDVAQEYAKRIALPFVLTPQDIAESVLFLASDAARMITGQTLVVDGGYA